MPSRSTALGCVSSSPTSPTPCVVLEPLFLDDAGVDDSVIARHGHWAMASMYKNYLQWFKAEGLYALGGWRGAAAKDFQQFWDPRFLVPVPVELVDLVMPFLTTLRNQVASLGDRAEASHRWGLF